MDTGDLTAIMAEAVDRESQWKMREEKEIGRDTEKPKSN
jgi:hypothetical protein